MKLRTIEGELFGKLVAMGLRAKDVASVVRACNGSMSACVVGAMLQVNDNRKFIAPLTRMVYLARHGKTNEEYIQKAADLIREAEEECQRNPYITTTKRPRKQSSARASSAQKQQNLPSLF